MSIAASLAVPLFSFMGSQIMEAVFDGPGDQLQMLAGVVGGQEGALAVVVIAFISIVPAFVEETLFRGYVQRRLLERWHPATAIVTTSLIFACAHVDPAHALATFFPGIWFGIVAWRASSVWPAMICHAAMNVMGSLGMMFGEDDGSSPWADPVFLGLLALISAAFIGSLFVMKRTVSKPRVDG